MLFHLVPITVRSVVMFDSQRKETVSGKISTLSEVKMCAVSTAQCTSERYVYNQNTIEESKVGLRFKRGGNYLSEKQCLFSAKHEEGLKTGYSLAIRWL